MQDHVVLARPERHGLDGRVADDQIDHDDDRAKFLCEFGASIHFFHRPSGDVEIMALDFAGLSLCFVYRLHHVEETITPVHERLRVDILVILHEIEATLQPFINDTAIIAARQTELWLGRRT